LRNLLIQRNGPSARTHKRGRRVMKVPLVKDLVRSMRHRTIVVTISPTPINFAERLSVLQVLEQQGPVEVFKRRAVSFQPSQEIHEHEHEHDYPRLYAQVQYYIRRVSPVS
jgi:hypothetical protein